MAEDIPHKPLPLPADFNQASLFLRQRRKAEAKGGAIEERTRALLTYLQDGSFLKWQQAGVATSFILDPQGLRIDVGPDSENGIHSHIPYRYLTSDYTESLRALGIPTSSVHEIEAVYADTAGESAKEIRDTQIQTLVKASRAISLLGSDVEEKQQGEEALLNLIGYNTPHVAKAMHTAAEPLHIPRSVATAFIRGTEPAIAKPEDHFTAIDQGERIIHLIRLAESLNASGEPDAFFDYPTNKVWQKFSDSHDMAQVNKHMFNSRSQTLHSWKQYESAKILDAVWETVTLEQLHDVGIRVVRGQYKDGLECIGFWRDGTYTRILHDPTVSLRSPHAATAYEAVPCITRQTFESLEAVMLPYKYFRTFAKLTRSLFFRNRGQERIPAAVFNAEYLSSLDGIRDFTNILLRVTVSDLRDNHRDLESAYENLVDDSGHVTDESLGAFVAAIDNATLAYSSAIDGREASEIIVEHAPLPHVRTVTFDEYFVEGMPESMRSEARPKYNPELSTSKRTVRVVESGPRGLQYVNEGRAMRALGIKPAPTIVVTGGAALIAPGSAEWQATEKTIHDILDVAFDTGANMLIPGTQSGIGVLFPKLYWKRFDSLDPEAKKKAPRMFAIEPGKELYYPGNARLDTSPGTSPWPLSIVDTITTSHHAGWTIHGSESEYRQHILYRQSFIKRASEGHSVVNVVLNGGPWTIMEQNEAIRDSFPILAKTGTGRFADMISRALADSTWQSLPRDAQLERFIDIAGTLPAVADQTAVRESLVKPFYQKEFLRFMNHMKTGVDQNVFAGDDQTFTEQLRGILSGVK